MFRSKQGARVCSARRHVAISTYHTSWRSGALDWRKRHLSLYSLMALTQKITWKRIQTWCWPARRFVVSAAGYDTCSAKSHLMPRTPTTP